MNKRAWHGRLLSESLPCIVAACLVGFVIALLPQTQLILLAAVTAALLVVGAIFAEPIVGLALALIVGPFQPLERVTLQLPLDSGQLVLALTLIAYSFRWLATRHFPLIRPQPTIAITFIIFITVCLLSFFPARDFRDWVTECVKWLQIGVVALLVAGEEDPRKRWIVLGAILISAAGQAIFGLIQSDVRGFGPPEFRIRGTDAYRAYGTFEQPNPFGGFMGLTWPVAAALALWATAQLGSMLRDSSPKHLARVSGAQRRMLLVLAASALVAALCVRALIASGSRGALAGAAAAGVALFLAWLQRPWRWVGGAFVLALTLLAFDVVNIPASLDAQLQYFSDPGSAFGLDVRNAHVTPITFSTIERLAHWQAALRMIESSPWLGVGFGNYAAAYPEFRLLPWENALGHAHNYYLNIFAEAGIAGLLAYLALWVAIIIATWRAARHGHRALSSVICIGVLGAWAHLTVHHLFDKLYVANMHLLIGAYLGFVLAAELGVQIYHSHHDTNTHTVHRPAAPDR
ncbi:MAG: O-antigen ligase family protein [Anaerolineae bacterium]|nr:O-antigen ligase family protein [Candidatus Roseilinea sp.]MDW8448804.1 O-antigen ligase family protein [Anaerolineae bacterium]